MLTPARALTLNADAGKELPRVRGLQALYDFGCRPRQGELVMIAGRSGSQKSGFALFLTAKMGLPTLYLSADMSAFTVTARLATMLMGANTAQIEAKLSDEEESAEVYEALKQVDHMTFSFASPITWGDISDDLTAYVEVHNCFPSVIVVDNLMDVAGGESDYTAQMALMQDLDALKKDTGATIIVCHHATDKSRTAEYNPYLPPSRSEVKGGLAEKPELMLGVALNPDSLAYHIAILKQRMGPSNPKGNTFASVRCDPERTTFFPL